MNVPQISFSAYSAAWFIRFLALKILYSRKCAIKVLLHVFGFWYFKFINYIMLKIVFSEAPHLEYGHKILIKLFNSGILYVSATILWIKRHVIDEHVEFINLKLCWSHLWTCCFEKSSKIYLNNSPMSQFFPLSINLKFTFSNFE